MRRIFSFILVLVFFQSQVIAQKSKEGTSFYQSRLEDQEAIYFTTENFQIKADGRTDVSDALQTAINRVKSEHNFGILFIPEGKYLISKTIYVPTAIRLIGYGKQRPEMILKKNSPGFQMADSSDKGQAKYMFWFTSAIVKPGEKPQDAGASTFYSAISNINFKIEDGNPEAVALRTHYAQHSFIAHADINIGKGKAGMFDVGNEMEDVRFFGGDYGIYTTKPSPGWPFMMVDTYFEGQRKAAVKTRESGLTILRMDVKNVPTVIDIDSNFIERLFMEDCRFDQVKGPAIIVSGEDNANNQLSLRNISCRAVPVLIKYRYSGKKVDAPSSLYSVKNFMHGLQMDSISADPEIKTIQQFQTLGSFPEKVIKDIPDFPSIASWINLKSLGAKGDGHTDDTKVIQDAINKYPDIYVPQGWYLVSETIHLQPNTSLIGLTPIGTQFILAENTTAFGSFGPPKPLIETASGGDAIFTGIGLSTGADNPRAVACKWMAGAGSYMNDVKFIGGHGGIDPVSKTISDTIVLKKRRDYWPGSDPSWDTQYWSLWITDGGGGTFKNIWTASSFATSGTYVSNTSTPGRIYAMSIEHHVRNEIRFNKVSNYKIYALQLEEESREGTDCLPVEVDNCHDMVFANLYMFRVIRINKPFPYSIRNWGSSKIEFLNVHNYSQTKYTTSVPLYSINTNTEVRPWAFNRLYIDKADVGLNQDAGNTEPIKLVTGFEFAEGITSDSKGNIYFCDSRMRRIYKWSADKKTLSLLADYPWEPLSLACDKKDNLLVVFKYIPKPGYMKEGKPEVFTNPPDAAGTSFSGWGNSGFGTLVYSIDPENADGSIHLLEKVKMGSVKNIYKALYPAHRRRDRHDFSTVTVNRPAECFVAPDSATIIPVVYDLARSTCLVEAWPGKHLYVSDEYLKRTVKLNVDDEGYVSGLTAFAERGEFGLAADERNNVYIADGQIYVYNGDGKLVSTIRVPERPTSITFGGTNKQTLFITGATSLYSVDMVPSH